MGGSEGGRERTEEGREGGGGIKRSHDSQPMGTQLYSHTSGSSSCIEGVKKGKRTGG